VVERAGGDDAERNIRPDQVRSDRAHGAVPAGRHNADGAVCDEIATAGSHIVAWLQDVDADLGQDRRDLRAHIRKTMRGHVPGPWIEDEANRVEVCVATPPVDHTLHIMTLRRRPRGLHYRKKRYVRVAMKVAAHWSTSSTQSTNGVLSYTGSVSYCC
jgi:hypothetical protein